jgi:hypothetical protein
MLFASEEQVIFITQGVENGGSDVINRDQSSKDDVLYERQG